MPHRIPIRLPAAFVAEDDRSLLERFAAGHDENAFAAIVGRYSRMVYGVCKRAMRDEHLAEDAFQAVFLVLARNPDRASSASSVAGWLFGIARRVGLAARRRESRRRCHEAKTAEKPAAGQPSDFDDLLRSLDEELAALPERFRAPLIACFLEEQTQDEAARQLGWSLSTLRRRLERGKELLRDRLARGGATLAATLFAATVAPSAHATVPVRLVAMAMHPSPRAQLLAAELARGAVAAKWGISTLALVLMTGLAAAFTRIPDATGPSAAAAATASTVEATPVPRQAQPSPVSLSGQVVFPADRDIPPLRFVPPNSIKDADFFGRPMLGDLIVDSKTRGIANVVVWLRPDSDDPTAAFSPEKLPATTVRDHLVQAGPGGFNPRIVLTRAGDRVEFANPTPIAFNVFFRQPVQANEQIGAETGGFNVLLPAGQIHTTKPLVAHRLPASVSDMIHPWVHAYVWAFDHPYFGVTDEKGNFAIPDVPAGKYRLMMWQEKVGYRDGAKGRLGLRITLRGEKSMNLGRVVLSSPNWDK